MRRPLLHLYGFTAAGAGGLPRRGLAGVEPPGRVECVAREGIAAIVSRVPGEDYEDAAIGERLRDPAWLAQRVERHNGVLLAFLEQGPLAPCRFGMRLRTRADVLDILSRYRLPVRKALGRLRDRVEWSVKAFAAAAPEPCQREDDGAAYLLGRVRQRASRQETLRLGYERAQVIVDALTPFVEDCRHLPLRDGTRQPLLNLACLVRSVSLPAMRSMLEDLCAGERTHHVTLGWSGPWPAYSFAGDLFVDRV